MDFKQNTYLNSDLDVSPRKRIAPLRHYQGDLQRPEAFSSTGNEQFIGGVQSIKAFPESVEEINIFSLDVTRKERQGEKKKISRGLMSGHTCTVCK